MDGRDKHGRFANAIDDRALLTLVRAILEWIAERADPPILPSEVSQASFDELRADAGYPKVKRAWKIAAQLGVTWRRLKEMALADERSTNQSLAAVDRRGPKSLTREDAVRSIQVVARALGATSLRPNAYEDARLELLDHERLHWRHKSSAPAQLLTLGQILNIAPFDDLAREAGLEPPAPLGNREGAPHLTALAGFYEELGYLPGSIDALRQYTAAKGYSLATLGPTGKKGVSESKRVFIEQWEASGKEWPGEVPREQRRVPSDVEPLENSTLPVKRRRSWSYEACIEALVKLLDEADGKPLTERRIASLVKGRPDMPSASTFDYWARKAGTSLPQMRDEAAEIKYGLASYAAQMDTPPAELDQAVVVEKFSAQFEAVTNLQAYAWTHRPKGRASEGKQYKSLIFAIFARATLTYRAVLHLCRGGYTEQADWCNRSLFEDMAYAHWVSLAQHQEEAVELLAKHTEYSALLANDSIQKHKDWLGEVGALRDVTELEAKRADYAKLFGDYGEKSWTTKSIYAIVGEIEQLWPNEETAKKELHGFYSLGHRINNQKLHNTSLSLNTAARQTKQDEEGTLVIRLGASPTDDEGPMIRALYGALFTYGRLTRLLISETGGDVAAFDAFYAQQLEILYKLAPSKRRHIARNDQCPCGTGKKYKNCHGA